MKKIYQSMEELIGKTPILSLNRLAKALGVRCNLLAKLESANPAGSAKDRVAKYMLDKAEAEGKLFSDSVIIEPTSGNTGIGLAAIAAVRGYRAMIVMPGTMSAERIALMRAYGAEVVLTDGALGMAGAIEKAKELAASLPHSFIPDQFANPANPLAHYETTGPEILADTEGEVDILVAGVGTGGTLTGAGRYLKEKKSGVCVVAAEPLSSPFLSKGVAGAHKIQGIGAGFLPKTADPSVFDEIVCVPDDDALQMARLVGKTEGVLVGISSGAALWAAIEVAKREENQGKNLVVILPDSGERYLSLPGYIC